MASKIRTRHIYGNTVLKSQYCKQCDQTAFVIDGEMSCCGVRAAPVVGERLKIECGSRRRKTPSDTEQRRILKNQENKCVYCDAEFGSYRSILNELTPVKLAWDHSVPFVFDGNNEFVAACNECNAHKHARHFSNLTEARTYLQIKLHEKQTQTL